MSAAVVIRCRNCQNWGEKLKVVGSAAIIDQTFCDGGIHCSGSRSYPGPSKNSILSSFSASRHCSSFNSVCTSWDSKLYHFCPFDGASFIAIRPKYTEQARRSLNSPSNRYEYEYRLWLSVSSPLRRVPWRPASDQVHFPPFPYSYISLSMPRSYDQLLLYYCAQEIGNVHQNFWARRIVDVAWAREYHVLTCVEIRAQIQRKIPWFVRFESTSEFDIISSSCILKFASTPNTSPPTQ